MASSPYVVTRGVIVRETPTRESDKILTLLTDQHGKCAVIARGARRKQCHYAAAVQPLAYAEWTLYHRGEWYYVREGTAVELFEGLRRDLDRLSLGFYFAELTEAVAMEETPSGPLLRHLLNGLYTLSVMPESSGDTVQTSTPSGDIVHAPSGTVGQTSTPSGVRPKPLKLVKAAFEIRLLCLAGFAPLADACVYCGKPDPVTPVWNVVEGVVGCRDCVLREGGWLTLPRGNVIKPLCRDSLAALRHIVYGEEKRLYAFRLGEEPLARLADASEAFVSAQLERSFRTLDFYHGIHPKQEKPL